MKPVLSHCLASLALAGLLLPGPLPALTVQTQFYGHADYELSSTYRWVEGQPALDPGAERHLRAALEIRLADKGWKKIESDDAHLLLRTEVLARQVTSIGILRVDIIDAASGELAWRGLASDVIESGSTKKLTKVVDKVVKKMMKDFPRAGTPR